jgi:hypothetical protein
VGKWIWRCHIDLTAAQPELWDFLRPSLAPYDAAVFTLKQYAKEDVPTPRVFCLPPAIDPLSPKNVQLAPDTVEAILSRYAIDPHRPVLAQVSLTLEGSVRGRLSVGEREIPNTTGISLYGATTLRLVHYNAPPRAPGLVIQISQTSASNNRVNAVRAAARRVKSLREAVGSL